MAVRKRNARGSSTHAGTVFWLAAIVVVLFIFALNWGKIQQTLAHTNFSEIVKTQTGEDKQPAPSASDQKNATPQAKPSSPSAVTPKPVQTPETPATGVVPTSSAKPAQPSTQTTSPPTPRSTTTTQPTVTSVQPSTTSVQPSTTASAGAAARNRSASLYFVRIDDDGVIVRQEVKRTVPVSDSPLLDSLSALIKGPSEDELRKKLISLVPQGTKLLSAQVRGSTAYLNFNEAFMYNHYGIEGYAGQLKQVVYTATAFPTVQDVQILIEGEKHDYLGGEGVFIGKPLSRNSF